MGQEHDRGRLAGPRRRHRRLGFARRRRQRPQALLAVPAARRRPGGLGGGRRRAAAAGRGRLRRAARRAPRVRQRAGVGPGSAGPRAGRLPSRHQRPGARDGRHAAGPVPAAAALDAHHPGRSAAAAQPPAGTRGPGRVAGRRLAVQRRRGGGVLQQPARPAAVRARRPQVAGADRGMGRGAAAGRSAVARPAGPFGFHRPAHRRGLAHRQLSRRGGAGQLSPRRSASSCW